MKKIFKILLILVLVLGMIQVTYSEGIATQTDIDSIIEDVSNQVAEENIVEEEVISIEELYPNHRIEIKFIQIATHFGEEAIIAFELIDYPPGEITEIEWQYSPDNVQWFPIEGAHSQTYSFIVTKENYEYWFRVKVSFHYNLDI